LARLSAHITNLPRPENGGERAEKEGKKEEGVRKKEGERKDSQSRIPSEEQ
jgi:hypothetical protein